MAGKMVQMGVRLPQDDAAFIAGLVVEGASTPSDKLRAIIAQARRREAGIGDYKGALAITEEMLAPVRTWVREAELHQQVHSELVMRTLDWLGEMVAFCMAGHTHLSTEYEQQDLDIFEKQLMTRLFRIIDSVMQMAVSSHGSCYNQERLNEQVLPVLDLAQVIIKYRATT